MILVMSPPVPYGDSRDRDTIRIVDHRLFRQRRGLDLREWLLRNLDGSRGDKVNTESIQLALLHQ